MLCRNTISPCLEENIDDLPILINCPPQIMLLALNLDENLINKVSIAVTLMFTFQSPGMVGTKFYAPQTNRLIAGFDTSLSEQTFDITIAEVESVVQPNCIADDIWRNSVAFVRRLRSLLSTIIAEPRLLVSTIHGARGMFATTFRTQAIRRRV